MYIKIAALSAAMLLVVTPLSAADPLGQDKTNHMVIMACINEAMMYQGVGGDIRITTCLGIAVAKELYDVQQGGRFDALDILAGMVFPVLTWKKVF
jgi:hypothetical protein